MTEEQLSAQELQIKNIMSQLENAMLAGTLIAMDKQLYSPEVQAVLSAEIDRHIDTLSNALESTFKDGVLSSRTKAVSWDEDTLYSFLALYTTSPDSLRDTILELFECAFLLEDGFAEGFLLGMLKKEDEQEVAFHA